MPTRIVSAQIQYILTTTDEHGEPIGEAISQTLRIFRAVQADVWAFGDTLTIAPPVPVPDFVSAASQLRLG